VTGRIVPDGAAAREAIMSSQMTLASLVCAFLLAATSAQTSPSRAQPATASCGGVNVLAPEEKAAGWLLLFDGNSMSGWHGYNKQALDSWTVDDCALKTRGTEGNYGSDKRADLVTDKEYTNFELTLDWKATKGGNSGVIYGVVEDPKYDAPWKTGPEYQLIDDIDFPHPLEPWQKAGANYAMHLPDPAKKRLKPVGEWNTTRIVVNGAHVEHWLNGAKILEFERWTPEWQKLRDSGKWKEAPDYGKAKTGRIALQDHGSIFWFRNVKIRPL
jgi:3-keto-disaccharide hydrolase